MSHSPIVSSVTMPVQPLKLTPAPASGGLHSAAVQVSSPTTGAPLTESRGHVTEEEPVR